MTPHIIIAEDNDDDFALFQRACRKISSLELVRAHDGAETVKLLQEQPNHHLLILDLKMPRMDGFEVLRWVRNGDHRMIPVVVLTSSAEPQDVARAYELGATSYFVKPVRNGELEEMMSVINAYWFRYCLPCPNGK